MQLSVVVPLYNENESVYLLIKKIIGALAGKRGEYEIILVDDGSSDGTYEKIRNAAAICGNVMGIKLKKNFGQTIALYAGIERARGEIIVTMDGDLQNDPEDILKMISKINEGYDIVHGWRYERKDKFFSRRMPSMIANWLIGKLTRVPVKDNGCAIRAYRADLLKEFPMYSEMHRMMPVITALAGAKYTQVKVKHHARRFGVSKYGLSRIFKVILDLFALRMVFSNFRRPLNGFGTYAVLTALISLAFIVYGIIYGVFSIGGSLIIPMGIGLLLGELSFFLLSMGIICHLVYKSGNIKIEAIYMNSKKKKKVI